MARKSTEVIKSMARKIKRLEEALSTQPQGGGAGEGQLSTITLTNERGTVDDTVTVTTTTEPSSQVIDDFEDGDVAEYGGDTGGASITTYPVDEGSNALEMQSASDGSLQKIISTSDSDLPYYPRDGDTYRYRTYIPSIDVAAHHYFGVQQTAVDDAYRLQLDPNNDDLVATEFASGSSTDLFTVDLGTLPTGQYVEVEVRWSSGGGFDAEVFDEPGGSSLGQGSATDSTLTDGGVGWGTGRATAGTSQVSSFVDFARTTSSAYVIDDFEDAGITEYSGDTGSAAAKNNVQIPVNHGTYALELSGSAEIHTASGNLNTDASQGNSFSSRHNLASGSSSRFLFAVQSTSGGDNHFFVEADESGGTWTIGKLDGGTESTIDQGTELNVPTGEWLRYIVDWGTDNSITATLEDASGSVVSTASGSDSTYTSGGHGWAETASSTTSYGDYARVTQGDVPAQITDGLLLWYKINEGSGSTATDSAGSNDGTITGASWTTTAKTGGQALDFDGTDDHIDMGTNFGPTGSDDRTYTCWIQVPSGSQESADHSIWGYADGGGEIHHGFLRGTSKLAYQCRNTSGANSTDVETANTYNDGNWHFFVCKFDGTNDQIEVDVDAGSDTDSTAFADSVATTSNTYVGARNIGGSEDDPIDAIIDDYRIYNRVLSDGEIQTIYDNTK